MMLPSCSRLAAALGLAAAVSACSSVAPLRTAETLVSLNRYSASEAQALPASHPQMRLRINEAGEGILLLARVRDGVQHWQAVDGKAIWLDQSGHLIATSGFSTDLLRHQWLGAAPDLGRLLSDDALEIVAQRVVQVQGVDHNPTHTEQLVYQLHGEPAPVQLDHQTVMLQHVVARVQRAGERRESLQHFWIRPDNARLMLSLQRIPGSALLLRMQAVPAQAAGAPSVQDEASGDGAGS